MSNTVLPLATDAARPARIAVIHYSATGVTEALARSISSGASSAGAEVRLRRVAETAQREVIDSNTHWRKHHDQVQEPDGAALATLADVEWADGIAFGSPTRFGLPAAQLKAFIDQTGGLWARGVLADKVITAFTAASTTHGGAESSILAMLNVAYHWGAIIMPLGYTDPSARDLGNPYGTSWISRKNAEPNDIALAAAHHQGARLARITAAVSANARSNN
jgi:NAD(P)H dehydrogenase (quinone)